MAEVHEIVESFCIMIVMIIVAFCVILAISVPWDTMDARFFDAGLESVSAAWNTFDDRDWLMQQVLIIAYALFILGPLQFVIVCTRRQEYDSFVYER